MAFLTSSLTGSKATYEKVGFVNGALLRPAHGGGVESTPAPKVTSALVGLGISTAKPIELQVKIEDGHAHFQWAGAKKNRDYGAAFDVINPWAKPSVSVSPEYLSEDEMA